MAKIESRGLDHQDSELGKQPARVSQLPRRNLIIGLDTAAVAATNAAVLIVGARLIGSSDLTALAMFQLLIATAVGLQRATLLTPALAAQRTEGVTHISVRWLLYFSLPFAVVAALALPLLVPSNQPYSLVVGLALLMLVVAVFQDLLRYALFSRDMVMSAFVADIVWLATFGVGILWLFASSETSWTLIVGLWAASGFVAVIACTVALVRERPATSPASVRATLRLGVWSGSDSALSSFANLLPMAVASLALGTSVAALYRILQVANGPFNILSSTFTTSVGLEAWRLDDREQVRLLRRRTFRSVLLLVAISVVYYAVAFGVLVSLTGLAGKDVLRVAITLGVAGVLGAATIPITAASIAMGYQRIGFLVRLVIVSVALTVSLLAGLGGWIPWNDPVGVVAIASSSLGLFGWLVGYLGGYRLEMKKGLEKSK
jgi:hypothetical protein